MAYVEYEADGKTIKARVQQKTDTLANWEANTKPILAGEQAFVIDGGGTPINFKIGDGKKKFSELPWWISYDQGQYVQVVGNALPTPTVELGYSFVGPGTYTHAGGDVVAPDGRFSQIVFNGSSWSLKDMGALPQTELEKAHVNLYDKSNNVKTRFINNSGSVEYDPNSEIVSIAVEAGKSYAVRASSFADGVFLVALRSSNSTDYGATLGLASLTNGEEAGVRILTIPEASTATHALFNIKLPLMGFDISDTLVINEGLTVSEESVIKINGLPVSDTSAIKTSDIKGIEPLYKVENSVSGKYVHTSAIIDSFAGSELNVFPVVAGREYTVYSPDFDNTAFVIAFRETSSSADGATLGVATLTATNDPNVKIFKAPSLAKFGFVNTKLPAIGYDVSDSLKINEGDVIIDGKTVTEIKGSKIADSYARQRIEEVQQSAIKSKLKGLDWLTAGDSITEVNFRSTHNYHYYISEMVGGMTIHNYGQSGTGYFSRYDLASTIPNVKLDLITLFFGTNDWGNQVATNQKPLGLFGDIGTTTISGCINKTLTDLIIKFPLTTIAIFTPLPRSDNYGLNAPDNAYGYNLKDLVDLLHQYATHFSLPILDLYAISNLYPWNSESNDHYFKAAGESTGDGLHPNDNGHKYLASKMLMFLESIV